MVSRESKILRLERELHRIRTSPSLRLGSIVTDAMRRPWLAPFLVLTLPWSMLMIGLEMLGKKSPPAAFERVTQDPTLSERNCVVIFPTNGVGFGHFTRMLALAKHMKNEDPALEIIFFTTMPTLHLLKPYGIPAHYISGSPYFDEMSTIEWNGLLEEELAICFEAHRPKQFIFDGAFPYRGMLRAIKARPHLDSIWMRRGTFRRGKSIPVDSISHFDLIIHPEDSIAMQSSEVEHKVPSITCPPITLIEPSEQMSRSQARRRLELPQDAIVVYVQIGAGEINDINSEVRLTVDALTKRENVHVVLGESMLGERFDIDLPRVHLLRDYPNYRYFKDFDFAVMAGGYNSFHEAIQASMPTICLPNMKTGRDDQLARVIVAEEAGCMVVIRERNRKIIQAAIDRIVESEVREMMKNNFQLLRRENGATQVADWISSQANLN